MREERPAHKSYQTQRGKGGGRRDRSAKTDRRRQSQSQITQQDEVQSQREREERLSDQRQGRGGERDTQTDFEHLPMMR